jgi:hypothetical protein
MKKIVISAENNHTFEVAVYNGPEGDIDRSMFGSAEKALSHAQSYGEGVILDGSAIAAILNILSRK